MLQPLGIISFFALSSSTTNSISYRMSENTTLPVNPDAHTGAEMSIDQVNGAQLVTLTPDASDSTVSSVADALASVSIATDVSSPSVAVENKMTGGNQEDFNIGAETNDQDVNIGTQANDQGINNARTQGLQNTHTSAQDPSQNNGSIPSAPASTSTVPTIAIIPDSSTANIRSTTSVSDIGNSGDSSNEDHGNTSDDSPPASGSEDTVSIRLTMHPSTAADDIESVSPESVSTESITDDSIVISEIESEKEVREVFDRNTFVSNFSIPGFSHVSLDMLEGNRELLQEQQESLNNVKVSRDLERLFPFHP